MALSVPSDSVATGKSEDLTNLPHGRISSIDVLANTISNVAPSVTAGVTIALIAGVAGTATPEVYLLVGLVLFALAIQIATLSYYLPSAGGIYSYVSKALHPLLGFIIAITGIYAIPLATGTVPLLAGNFLLLGLAQVFHFPVNIIEVSVLGIVILLFSAILTHHGVRLSSRVGLFFELMSVLIFSFSAFLVLLHKPEIDTTVVSWTNPLDIPSIAFIFAIYSYGGFTTAGHLAIESKNRKIVAPAMMLLTLALSAVFFIFISYCMLVGFDNNAALLGKSPGPFDYLGSTLGYAWMGPGTDFAVGAALLAGTISALNTQSRLLFSMSRHGILPRIVGRVHQRHLTPHVGNTLVFLLMLPVLLFVYFWHTPVMVIMGAVEGVTSIVLAMSWLIASVSVPVLLWKKHYRGLNFYGNTLITFLFSAPMMLFLIYSALVPFPTGIKDILLTVLLLLVGTCVVFFVLPITRKYVVPILESFSQ